MQSSKSIARALTFLTIIILVSPVQVPREGRAAGPVLGNYSLSAVPSPAQEGTTITLALVVSGIGSSTGMKFQFRFNVRDPSGATAQSAPQNYTTAPNQDEFTILLNYPSASFPGSNSLNGLYSASVDELMPIATPQVAMTTFTLSITDSLSYERTLTVNIHASRYNASETVTVTIRTVTTSTLVFSQMLAASTGGIVATSWQIPKNATIDNYQVTITGTTTVKNPADTQKIAVRVATMMVQSITSWKNVYQRTDALRFTFQPKYPDGSIASTGVALMILTRPDRGNTTLAATYDSTTQMFTVSYLTTPANETGTWTASLSGHAYSDAYGNNGPGTIVTSSPQLTTAALSVSVSTSGTSVNVGQAIRFNATVAYPDGTIPQSGAVGAYLLYNVNQQTINDTISMVYDTGLMLWVGTYTPKASDTGGLWSLVVKASDGSTPADTGSATRAITIQNASSNPGSDSSVPLYYFALLAGLLIAILLAALMIFRRHKTTHAKLKIDIEAVRSEANKIENEAFFQSVKDQLQKNKSE